MPVSEVAATVTNPRESEKNLLRRMAAQEPAAWEEFLHTYGDLLYSTLYYALRDRFRERVEEEVQDAMQELLLMLSAQGGRKLLSFEGRNGCSLAGWLRTVAIHYAYEVIRKNKPTLSLEEIQKKQGDNCGGAPAVQPTIRKEIDEKSQMERIDEAVGRLSAREQLLFRLYYHDERPRDEIARALQATPNNVDQMLFRIRSRLGKILGDDKK